VASLRSTIDSLNSAGTGTIAGGQQPAVTFGQSGSPSSPPPLVLRPDVAKSLQDSRQAAQRQSFAVPQTAPEDSFEGWFHNVDMELPPSTGFNKRLQQTGVGPTTAIDDRTPARTPSGTIPRQGTIGVTDEERKDQIVDANIDTLTQSSPSRLAVAAGIKDIDRTPPTVAARAFSRVAGYAEIPATVGNVGRYVDDTGLAPKRPQVPAVTPPVVRGDFTKDIGLWKQPRK
jgi:hypothetical protein